METRKIGTAYVLLALLAQATSSYAKVSEDDAKRVASNIVRDVKMEANALEVTRANNVNLPATFHVDKDWTDGYQITVTVKNPSSVPTSHWVASFNLPNTTETVASFWGGSYTKSGTLLNIASIPCSSVIPAGGSVRFGFIVGNAVQQTRTLTGLKVVGTAQLSALTTPAVPVLESVERGDNQTNYTVYWNAVDHATSYTLQQSLTPGFENPTVVYEGNDISKLFVSQPNNTYYYRVVASNASGSSSFSNIQTIVVSSAPALAAPILNPVIQGSNTGNYTVSWTDVNTAVSYTLEESTSKDFHPENIVYQGPAVSKAFTNRAKNTYYYRVQAANAAGTSVFSNVQSVRVGSTGIVDSILGIFRS